MYTIKKIIDNQSEYRKDILKFLTNELREAKKILVEIDSDDEFIISEIEKLKEKFKKIKFKKEIDKLFFMHPKRNQEYYAWWDKTLEEVLILTYGKK